MTSAGNAAAVAFPRREECAVQLPAAAADIFMFLDAHENIAAHMSKPSVAMLGGSMTTTLDELSGRAVGSVVRVEGKVLGITVSLTEKIVQREPPWRKFWQTFGTPRLIVMGGYRMGFDIEPTGAGCKLVASIDYELPHTSPDNWLGVLFGRVYARWCVQQIIQAAVRRFNNTQTYAGQRPG